MLWSWSRARGISDDVSAGTVSHSYHGRRDSRIIAHGVMGAAMKFVKFVAPGTRHPRVTNCRLMVEAA